MSSLCLEHTPSQWPAKSHSRTTGFAAAPEGHRRENAVARALARVQQDHRTVLRRRGEDLPIAVDAQAGEYPRRRIQKALELDDLAAVHQYGGARAALGDRYDHFANRVAGRRHVIQAGVEGVITSGDAYALPGARANLGVEIRGLARRPDRSMGACRKPLAVKVTGDAPIEGHCRRVQVVRRRSEIDLLLPGHDT